MSLFEKGSRYQKFFVTKNIYLEEIQTTLIELEHEPTGAMVMHLGNQDPENLFSLSFKTYPNCSNGAPHILEHTVLCGSKKFPIKDPFFSMLRRSLNTFMNAMTGSDFTCYPASSQVEKDFYNLLSVYLDAVFHPLLNPLSFSQEGHRLEFEEPLNPKSLLLRKGVVYNEMKGAMASADSRLWEAIGKYLMPDLPYAHNSGGEPKVIAKMSHQDLIDFHKTFYHPSRCLFFFYGNLPLEKHLDFIENNVLQDVEKIPPLSPMPKQKRFKKPLEKEVFYPLAAHESIEKKTILSFSWLTAPLSNQEDVLALHLLDSILTDTDASILKYALLSSGLCSQVESYFDTEMSEVPLTIVCRGCEKKDKEAIYHIIDNTLKKVIEEKIPEDLINASLHQMELSRSEITRNQAPYGLTLFFRSALSKQHGAIPENNLLIHSLFQSLREKLKDPNYLTSILKKYVLDNPHRLTIIMPPDLTLDKKEHQEERKELDALAQKLSEKEKQKIIEDYKTLDHFQTQQAEQSIECLPKIHVQDIPQEEKDYPLSEQKWKNLTLYHHDCFTNQVLYVDLLFDLCDLGADDLVLVSLLSSILTELGTAGHTYQENLQFMHAHTGDISAYLNSNISSINPKSCTPSFAIRGKALYRNSDKLFSMMKDFLSSCDLTDKKRIKELLLQQYTYLQQTLTQHAVQYAISLSYSGMDVPSYLDDRWHGLSYYYFLQDIMQNIDEKLPAIIEKLMHLQQKIFTFNNLHLVITCDKDHLQSLQNNNFYNIDELTTKPFDHWIGSFPIPTVSSQAKIIPAPISFSSIAYDTIGYHHKDAPFLMVASSLFEHIVLHARIREQGGAYGSGARYQPDKGKFHFFTFRDPHIVSSIDAIYASQAEIAKGLFSNEELEEAKLSIMQGLDKPIGPQNRAIVAYYWQRNGLNKKARQKFRKKILEASKEEIQKAVEEHLLSLKGKEIIVSFAGKDLLEKENTLLANLGKPTLSISTA